MKNLGLWFSSKFRNTKDRGHSVSFAKAKSIGILLHNPDYSKNKELNQFVADLIKAGKQVEVLCFLDKQVNRLYEFPYIEVRKSDIDVLGRFKDEKINKFIKTRFDYLYSINNSPFLLFESILRRSQSGIRIGKYFKGSDQYLDLMIDLNNDASISDLLKKINELVPKLSFYE